MPTLIIRGSDGSEESADLPGERPAGREAGNDLVVADKGASRLHHRFFVDESSAAFAEDHQSSNGVFVDCAQLDDQATEVWPGAEVHLGGATAWLEGPRAARGPSGRARAMPPGPAA
jgi:pSer/pThr/pTyr-binding forkhead associated (FHA) protein